MFTKVNLYPLYLPLSLQDCLCTRHTCTHILPPSPMGHISEPDESSVSLNKTAHSNRFVQMVPTALKAGTESLLWQIRHVKGLPPFAVWIKQKETYKYWIAPLLVCDHPPEREKKNWRGELVNWKMLDPPFWNSEHLGWGCQMHMQNDTEATLSIRFNFHFNLIH